MNGILSVLLLLLVVNWADCKIHHLALQDDARRNIILTSFGYSAEGTFDLWLSNFTVPDKISGLTDSSEYADKMGVIGFSLSRGSSISAGVGSNPHVCQLQQTDQGFDALFLLADLPQSRLNIFRSGLAQKIRLCRSHDECAAPVPPTDETPKTNVEAPKTEENDEEKREKRSFIEKIKKLFSSGDSTIEYVDFIPLLRNDNQYSTNISIRFTEELRGKYHFIYHNCFNYREQGYSSRVAVDFTVDIVEKNVGSFLSAGDIPKPHLYLYISLMFLFAGALWTHNVCMTDSSNVYRVHRLMTCLVYLKALSLFFHGVNFYFVSKYGHQREIWAVVFYITHLLKGALLFGTIILIGTGYTFFKNFLTERDRKVFMFVLPLQIIDNMAMIIMEESEFGQQSYQLWYEMFVFLDMICCFFVFFPIIWSMQHLSEGARSDGKAAFNLEKLKLFRQFYMIVICYIYLTRIIKFLLLYGIPFDLEWVCTAVVEVATLFFFVLVGHKFRPQAKNPYLKLSQDESEDDDDIALTQNGLLEGVISRGKTGEERLLIEDIPGTIGGLEDSDEEDVERRLTHPEKTLL